jgi:hypothetical protein
MLSGGEGVMAVVELAISGIGMLAVSAVVTWYLGRASPLLPRQQGQDRGRLQATRPDRTPGGDLVFRPPPATRWLNTLVVPALLIVVAVTLPFTADPAADDLFSVLASLPAPATAIVQGALLVLAGVLAIRNWCLAVRIEGRFVSVQSVLRRRRIPIEQVTQVTATRRGYAVICWTEPSGRRHEAALPGFWAHRMSTPVNSQNRAVLESLARAIKANRRP